MKHKVHTALLKKKGSFLHGNQSFLKLGSKHMKSKENQMSY